MRMEQLAAITSSRLKIIEESAALRSAAISLSDPQTGMTVVCNGAGTVTGVLTKSDLVRYLANPGSGAACADKLMSKAVISCRPNDDLHQVWQDMIAKGLQNIPVVDISQKPIGVLDIRDAMKVLLEQEELQEHMLVNYIVGVGYR